MEAVKDNRINYLGRMHPRTGFTVFVYAPDGKSQLAKTADEYESLIKSGLWFDTREIAFKSKAKTQALPKK